jgi:hypothetical protein
VQQQRPGRRDEPNDEAADRQTARLGGVAITLLLPVVSLFLVRELRGKVPIEDCLIAGRVNCNLLAATPSDPSATISWPRLRYATRARRQRRATSNFPK